MLDAINAEIATRGVPGIIERFTKQFPKGFREGQSWEEEGSDKEAASRPCQEPFPKEAFRRLLEQRNWDTLTRRFKAVVEATNLNQLRYERPRLPDAVADPLRTEPFFTALYDDLWGEADPLVRFDRICQELTTFVMGKWTYATYVRFLMEFEQTCSSSRRCL